MKRIVAFLLPLLFVIGCGTTNEQRANGYVTQPSVLLTKYNISHMRLHIQTSDGRSGVLTFSGDTFTYNSVHVTVSGIWESDEYPTVVETGESRYVVRQIDYLTVDGIQILTTTFVSNEPELFVGDSFYLSGDYLLSGTITQIELNNIL